MYPVLLRTERLALREFTVDDVDGILAVYGDSQATEHLSFEPRSREQVGQILARSMVSAVSSPRDEYALGVVRQEGEQLIGFARLALEPQRAGTIGFALRPDAWGVGYGTETVRALLALAFNELGLHRVWAARSPVNDASARTLEQAGMIEEGRIRDHVHVRGAWRDSITYSVLEHEWRGTN